MLVLDYLEMQKQDLVTKNNQVLNDLLKCFEEVLRLYPSTTEINEQKTVEDCYTRMEKYAQDHCLRCFSPSMVEKIIIGYLDLDEAHKLKKVNLEDFF